MCKMNQGRETRMETETQKMVTRERVILMMLETAKRIALRSYG